MSNLEIIAWVVVLLLAFLANFTTLSDGNIKFVDAFETHKKILQPGQGFWAWIGLYWIGIRGIHRVRKFNIKKEKPTPEGADAEHWISSDGKEYTVNSLLIKIPKPFVLKQVELGDRTKVDILVVALFESKLGKKFVYDLKGDFLKIGSALRSKVADKVKSIPDLATFIATDKSETSGFLKPLSEKDSDFNKELSSYSDLIMLSIEIPQYDADDAIMKAANEEAIAKLKAKAEVAAAEGEAAKIKTLTEAQAENTRKLAEAEIDTIMESLDKAGATSAEKVQALQEIVKWRSVKSSNLTTLIEKGGGGLTTIPVN